MIGRKRPGRPSDIIRFDHHDPWGRLVDRVKGKITEKDIGLTILDKVESLCDISRLDREEFKKKMDEREMADWDEMKRQAEQFKRRAPDRKVFGGPPREPIFKNQKSAVPLVPIVVIEDKKEEEQIK